MKKTGDEYYDSDEFREILAEYEEAVNSGSPVFMDADELAEIADYYQMTERYEEAEEAIDLALSLSPGAIAPLTYKIHEAIYHGDIEEAERLCSQIIQTDEPEYVYNRAEIMLAQGQLDEADEFLREQLHDMPSDEYQDYVVDVANIYQDYGYSEKAMEWVARAKQEDSPDFKELIARTLFGLGKYKDSERLWGELIDANPFSKRYWNGLASVQYMNEDYSGAVQSSEFAIAIDPDDPDGLFAKANSLYRLANYEGALDYYERYAQHEPDDELAYLHQGTCLINLGRTQEAIQVLEHAVDMADDASPYLCDIYQELAFAYGDEGMTDKALELIDKTDNLDCDHTQMDVIRGHILLANDKIREAERYFRKAVTESDDPNQTLMRVIVSVYDNKYVEAAHTLFKRYFLAVGTVADEGYAYMALCCYDLKKYDEFLSYLKTACERNPQECRMVLSQIFPEDVEPKDYYNYIKDKLKK
ncbi:MAG: tetratricopeptide repeat protein [Prevotella sp.]|nr:tetratricopeptide repeat protein [Prevotella sp.]